MRRGVRDPARRPPRREPAGAKGGGRCVRRDAPEMLYGVHPVEEALEARRREIERVLVARERGAGLGRLLRRAREAGVPVTHLPRRLLTAKAGPAAAHQGVVAVVSPIPYADPQALAREAEQRADALLLALDGVQDPRNLGAIVRTAAAAGVLGVFLSAEGSVGLTPVVAKASAGSLDRLPVAREARLAARLRGLRESGVRSVALDVRGVRAWDATDLTGRLIVVAGGEGKGLRRGIFDTCDEKVAVPMAGGVPALNVSVCVGIVLFEALRQRRAAAAGRQGS